MSLAIDRELLMERLDTQVEILNPFNAVTYSPKDVDAGAFSQDTQATQMGPGDDFSMFWWIPVEFWEASAAKQGAHGVARLPSPYGYPACFHHA